MTDKEIKKEAKVRGDRIRKVAKDKGTKAGQDQFKKEILDILFG